MASRAGGADGVELQSPARSEDEDAAEQAQNVKNWPPSENQRVRVKQPNGEWVEAVILKIVDDNYNPGTGNTSARDRITLLRDDRDLRENEIDKERLQYECLKMTDVGGKKPFDVILKNVKTTKGQPWDDRERVKFNQIVKQLSEDITEMDEEDVHALLSNEASKIDKSLMGSDEDDKILNLLEVANVDGEKLLELSKEMYDDIVGGNRGELDKASGDGSIVSFRTGRNMDMFNNACMAIWKAIQNVIKRHETKAYADEKRASYKQRWRGLGRFLIDESIADEDRGSKPLPYEVIDLNLRRYGVFYFAKVVNQIGIGQTNELWRLLNFLALRMSTPVVVRLLNYFIDDFSKFDPDDKRVLDLCKHIVEGAEFPIATALLMAAFMEEVGNLDRQNREMWAFGGEEQDLEKSIGCGNFQTFFIEGAKEILETVESDHLALILLECPTNLPNGAGDERNLSAIDIALRYDLYEFVGSSRIKRITGTMWTVGYDLLKPETTFRVKEVRCCDYALGLWDGCCKNGQGPRDWFNSPFGKFITEILSYLIFLFFFTYLTFERKSVYSEFDILEMMLYVFVCGFFLKEFWDILDDWVDYFTEDTVNYLDCSIMLLFVATILIRMDERFEWSSPTECDETCSRFCNGKSAEYPYMAFPVDPTHTFPEPLPLDAYASKFKGNNDYDGKPLSIYDDWTFPSCILKVGAPNCAAGGCHCVDDPSNALNCKADAYQAYYGTAQQCTDNSGDYSGEEDDGKRVGGGNRSPVLTFYDKDANRLTADRREMIYGLGTDRVRVPVYFSQWGTVHAYGLTAASLVAGATHDATMATDAQAANAVAVQVVTMKKYTDLFHPGYVKEGKLQRPMYFATYGTVTRDSGTTTSFTPGWSATGLANFADPGCETVTRVYRTNQFSDTEKGTVSTDDAVEIGDYGKLSVGPMVVKKAIVKQCKNVKGDNVNCVTESADVTGYELEYSQLGGQQHYHQNGAVTDQTNEHPYSEEVGSCWDTSPVGLRLPCGEYTTDDDGEYSEPCPATNFFDDMDGSARFGPEPVGWFFTGTYLRYSNFHHSPRDSTGNVKYGADAQDDWFGDWLDTDVEPERVVAKNCDAPASANNLAIEDRGFGKAVGLHGNASCGAGAWVYKNMNCQDKIKTSRSLAYKITWSIIIILMSIRILWFLDIFESFGKFRKICLLMLNPLIIFLIFLIIICFGFCMAFYFVAGDTAVETFGRFGDAAFWTMNAVQGDIDYDPIIADNSWDYGDQIRVGSYSATAAIAKGVDKLLNGAQIQAVDGESGLGPVMDFGQNFANFNYGIEGPPELQNIDEPRSFYIKTLMMVFLLLGAVMLLNFLVAIMATVYEEIEDDAYNQVQYQVGKNSIIKDKATGLLPAPFNIIVWAVTFVWLVFEHLFMLSTFYIDLEPYGQAFRDREEEEEERKLQTERMATLRSKRSPIGLDTSPRKDQIGQEEPSQLEFSKGDEELQHALKSGADSAEEETPNYDQTLTEPEKACCTFCTPFGCQVKRGPPTRHKDGQVDDTCCTRLKNSYKMVWGGVDEQAWWCSYCNSLIDPNLKGADGKPYFKPESELLNVYYQKYEEAAAPLDGPDKLMIRKMAPKLCPACYRRRDEADRCRVLTEIMSYLCFMLILWIPFSIFLFPLWAMFQVAKVFMASKLRKNMESDVESKGELVMPHPKDIKDEFGTAEKYRILFKGPYAANNVWRCAENALGIEVGWSVQDVPKPLPKTESEINLKHVYGFDFNRTLHVIHVEPQSPAWRAGVELGYQITDVDDTPVRFLGDLKDEEEVKASRIKTNLISYLKKWIVESAQHGGRLEVRFNNSKVAVEDSDIVAAMNREKASGQGLNISDIKGLLQTMLKPDMLADANEEA